MKKGYLTNENSLQVYEKKLLDKSKQVLTDYQSMRNTAVMPQYYRGPICAKKTLVENPISIDMNFMPNLKNSRKLPSRHKIVREVKRSQTPLLELTRVYAKK